MATLVPVSGRPAGWAGYHPRDERARAPDRGWRSGLPVRRVRGRSRRARPRARPPAPLLRRAPAGAAGPRAPGGVLPLVGVPGVPRVPGLGPPRGRGRPSRRAPARVPRPAAARRAADQRVPAAAGAGARSRDPPRRTTCPTHRAPAQPAPRLGRTAAVGRRPGQGPAVRRCPRHGRGAAAQEPRPVPGHEQPATARVWPAAARPNGARLAGPAAERRSPRGSRRPRHRTIPTAWAAAPGSPPSPPREQTASRARLRPSPRRYEAQRPDARYNRRNASAPSRSWARRSAPITTPPTNDDARRPAGCRRAVRAGVGDSRAATRRTRRCGRGSACRAWVASRASRSAAIAVACSRRSCCSSSGPMLLGHRRPRSRAPAARSPTPVATGQASTATGGHAGRPLRPRRSTWSPRTTPCSRSRRSSG